MPGSQWPLWLYLAPIVLVGAIGIWIVQSGDVRDAPPPAVEVPTAVPLSTIVTGAPLGQSEDTPTPPPTSTPQEQSIVVDPTPALPAAAPAQDAPAPNDQGSRPAGCGEAVPIGVVAAYAAQHSWGTHSPDLMAEIFAAESGSRSGGYACTAIVSPWGDHGCTQIHWTADRGERWDFDEIRGSCQYAVAVAAEVFAERESSGMCGICAWFAGRGWAW